MDGSFFSDLLASIAERGRSVLKLTAWPRDAENVGRARRDVQRAAHRAGRGLRNRACERDSRPVPRAFPTSTKTRSIVRWPTISGPTDAGSRTRWRASLRPAEDPRRARSTTLPSRAGRNSSVVSTARRAARPPWWRCAPTFIEAMRGDPRPCNRRSRFSAPLRLLVQPRLSGAAPDRLVLAGRDPGEDHPLRGGA